MHSSDDTKGWRPAKDLRFARNLEAIALAAEEIPHVAQSIPVAFIFGAKGWRAMAAFGPGDGVNRYVTEPTWSWRGDYIPALMRAYPFMLEPQDEGSIRFWPGVAPEPLEEGVFPLFEDGKPAARVRQIFGFLRQVHSSMTKVQPALEFLAARDLLVPWVTGEDKEMTLGDQKLFVIEPDGFAALPNDAFLALRDMQALAWIYAHLHSLHHSKRFHKPAYEAPELVNVDQAEDMKRNIIEADLEILSALSEDLGDFEL